MADLTVLFITANLVPKAWAMLQWEKLQEATSGYPIITIGREDGYDIKDTGVKSPENIYRLMLDGAKQATTPYVAIAEDDVLYHKDHFNFYRPSLDTFAYNQNRFALFTWNPVYSWRNRKSNCSLIAPRELMIEALGERFAKHPNGMNPKHTGELGRERVDRWLGVTVRKSIEVYSETSIIQFNHELATEDRQQRRRKALGPIKAYDIPFWGRSIDLVEWFV